MLTPNRLGFGVDVPIRLNTKVSDRRQNGCDDGNPESRLRVASKSCKLIQSVTVNGLRAINIGVSKHLVTKGNQSEMRGSVSL